MPHYKCLACKLRLHRSEPAAELDGDLCPECGCLLELVAAPSEIVGFRAVTPVDQAVEEQWLGDGDRPAAAAISLPPPETAL